MPSDQGCPSKDVLHLAQDQEVFPGTGLAHPSWKQPQELLHREQGTHPSWSTGTEGMSLGWVSPVLEHHWLGKNGNLRELGTNSELDLCTNDPG